MTIRRNSSSGGGTPGPTTLSQLTDVSASSPSDGSVLVWSASTSKWVPSAMRSATHAGTVIGSDLASGTVSVSFVGGGSVSNAACFTPTLPALGSTVLCELASDGSTVVTGVLVSPWAPAEIPGMTLWLDASDAGTLTQAGGRIVQWADKSGSTHNGTPYGSVPGPVIHAGALNSKNVVAFGEGGRSGLRLPIFAASSTFTIAGVTAPPYAVGQSVLLGGSNSTNLQIAAPGNDFVIYSQNLVSANGLPLGGPMSFMTQFGPSAFIRVNGAQVAAGNSGARAMPQPILGAAGDDAAPFYFEGGVAELLAWDRALSPAEYLEVEAYLKSKWGTP